MLSAFPVFLVLIFIFARCTTGLFVCPGAAFFYEAILLLMSQGHLSKYNLTSHSPGSPGMAEVERVTRHTSRQNRKRLPRRALTWRTPDTKAAKDAASAHCAPETRSTAGPSRLTAQFPKRPDAWGPISDCIFTFSAQTSKVQLYFPTLLCYFPQVFS